MFKYLSRKINTMKTDLVLDINAGKGNGFDSLIAVKLSKPDSKPSNDLVIAVCKDENDIRKAAENKSIDIILGMEDAEKKDSLHERKSGLNDVICKLAKKKNIAIGFSFTKVLHSNNRSLLMGRMAQNAELCRKYKVKTILASFAETKWDVRSYNELISFGLTIGMTPKEAKEALEYAPEIVKEKKEERLPQGVKVVR